MGSEQTTTGAHAKYSFRDIERKWQDAWKKADIFRASEEEGRGKFYGLCLL